MKPKFFKSASDFRVWLAANYSSASELIVGFRKVGAGLPSMTWPESVDQSQHIRFSPRRAGSVWSDVNVVNFERLLKQGRMNARGAAAYEGRSSRL